MNRRLLSNVLSLLFLIQTTSCEGVQLNKQNLNISTINAVGEIIYTGNNRLDTNLNQQCASFYQGEFNDTIFQFAGATDELIVSTLFETPTRRIKRTSNCIFRIGY